MHLASNTRLRVMSSKSPISIRSRQCSAAASCDEAGALEVVERNSYIAVMRIFSRRKENRAIPVCG